MQEFKEKLNYDLEKELGSRVLNNNINGIELFEDDECIIVFLLKDGIEIPLVSDVSIKPNLEGKDIVRIFTLNKGILLSIDDTKRFDNYINSKIKYLGLQT